MNWEKVPIANTGLGMRALNALRRNGVHTVAGLVTVDEEWLKGIRNIGEITLNEILKKKEEIAGTGIALAGKATPSFSGEDVSEWIASPENRARLSEFFEQQDVSLEELKGLTVRPYNALMRAGIRTVSAVLARRDTELMLLPGMGYDALGNLKDALIRFLNVKKTEIRLWNQEHTERIATQDDPSGMPDWIAAEINRQEQKETGARPELEAEGGDLPIQSLTLSVRAKNALMKAGYRTLGDILDLDAETLSGIPNIGATTVRNILESVSRYREMIEACAGNEPVQHTAEKEEEREAVYREVLKHDIPVRSLSMPIRAKNAMLRAGYSSLSQIIFIGEEDLAKLANIGDKTVQDILTAMEGYRARALEKARSPMEEEGADGPPEDSLTALKQIMMGLFSDRGFEGLSLRDIRKLVPGKFGEDEELLKKAAGSLISEGKLTYTDYRLYRVHISFLEALNTALIKDDRSRVFLIRRIKGETLQQIADSNEMTRERVRQICEKGIRRVRAWLTMTDGAECDEEFYRYFYQTYDFDRQTGAEWFGLTDETYNYLGLMKGKREGRSLEEAPDDEKLHPGLRLRVRCYLNRNRVPIGDEWLEKQKGVLEDYVLRTYCRDGMTLKQFVDRYNRFLEEEGIAEPSLLTDESSVATRANRMRESDLVLWKQNEMLRYYDIKGRDYTELLEQLGMDSYENIEFSTLKLMEMYPEVMRKYDIRDQYELHNLLRKILPEGSYHGFKPGRMPVIGFGKFDRKSAFFDMIIDNAPVSNGDLAELIHREYGFDTATLMASLPVLFSEYYHQGVYDVDQKEMSQEKLTRLKAVLTEDLYFFDELRAIYGKMFPDGDPGEINPLNLKRMGFRVASRYAYQHFPTVDAYFRDLLARNDITDIGPLRSRFCYVGLFSQTLVALKREKEVFEFEHNRLISIRRLEQNGITKEDVQQFADDVFNTVGTRSFNIRSLTNDGFRSKILDLGFSDWFYNDILSMDGRFAYSSFLGTTVLSKNKDEMTLALFLKEVVGEYDGIDVYDLLTELEQVYGCSTTSKWDVLSKVQEAGVYHDRILDRLYSDKDAYYRDVLEEGEQ